MYVRRILRMQCFTLSRRWTPRHVVALLSLLILIYNEFFIYVIYSWRWQDISISDSLKEDQLRILFVADPQIIGLLNENHIFSPVTRWDADRYLSKTFRRAFNYVQPDVIVYLGDLLDEGSISETSDYRAYLPRFQNLFSTPEHVQHIYIPGDNDVGGEAFDVKSEFKVIRFEEVFLKNKNHIPGVANSRFVDFLLMNYDHGQNIDESVKEKMESLRLKSSAKYRIILNHMSLLPRHRDALLPIVEILKPNIIFSAHTHHATLHTCSECHKLQHSRWSSLSSSKNIGDFRVYDFSLADPHTLHEVAVPTCSYRMGVPNMGYGAAVLDKDGRMKYTVLWLPSRYYQLFGNAVLLIVLLVIGLVRLLIWLLITLINRSTRYSYPHQQV